MDINILWNRCNAGTKNNGRMVQKQSEEKKNGKWHC